MRIGSFAAFDGGVVIASSRRGRPGFDGTGVVAVWAAVAAWTCRLSEKINISDATKLQDRAVVQARRLFSRYFNSEKKKVISDLIIQFYARNKSFQKYNFEQH